MDWPLEKNSHGTGVILFMLFLALAGCATPGAVYRDPNMDFGQIETIAVMPFSNYSRDNIAGDRVRDVFVTLLQGTGAVYVVPPGEVARGINRIGIPNPSPTAEDHPLRRRGGHGDHRHGPGVRGGPVGDLFGEPDLP
jgi:hypothetical protein